ncbi:MAG: hypothetical protein JF587_11450 [Catenulisporales bacterium]|nr:hypothetical protein [Catenulisporales bacterium]
MVRRLRPWLKFLAFVLLVIGGSMFFGNSEAIFNDGVSCGGQSMRPDEWCRSVDGPDPDRNYDEQKKHIDRERGFAYAGVTVGGVGLAMALALGVRDLIAEIQSP